MKRRKKFRKSKNRRRMYRRSRNPVFRASFKGREIGAIGIFYPISTTVEAKNKEEAKRKLYDRYEHLTGVKLTRAKKTNPKGKGIKQRLEHLRRRLRAENMSYDELHELQSLASHIDPDDVELLEAAGVPEFGPERKRMYRKRKSRR